MRFTIDIKDSILGDLLKLTGSHKRSPAVAQAVEDYVRRQKMRELGRLIREGAFAGAFDPDYHPDFPQRSRFGGEQTYSQSAHYGESLVLAEDRPEYGAPERPEPVAAPVSSVPFSYKRSKKRKNGPR
ncbi:MAG: type II toxin-antitoxin system VapB family antitoxin [Puniceicoccales bacterium]|jgi:hypothetical protein|nr:type II toxin-antitoxin system VapB family antitoxin [Puniceicoccales bacterium]